MAISIDPIRESVSRTVNTRDGFFKSAAPVALGISLLAAVLLPVAVSGQAVTAASLAGVVGSVGQNLLAGIIQDFIKQRHKDKPSTPASEDAARAALEAALTAQWQSGGAAAVALRAEMSQVLQATQAVDVALAAATGDVKRALAQGLAELGEDFDEFHWVLAGVRHTLDEMRAEQSFQVVLQKEQLELQRQQLFKLNLLIQRQIESAPQSAATLPDELDKETNAPADVPCPYKGLASFQAQDAAHFFGREGLLAEVSSRLSAATFYALVGPSGSGKSSLLRAGLLPGVYRGSLPGEWTSLVINPGAHPLYELATRAAINANLTSGELLADVLQADGNALDQALEQLAGTGHLLLAVDQFEEIFTLCRAEAERRQFVQALLGAASRANRRTSVVLALRADHYGDCAAYPELAAALQDSQTLVGALSLRELRQVIERPAARVGLRVQPELVDQIIEDVAGQPGALPLLSHVLLETWKRRRGHTMTLSGYHEAGGVSGAIAQTAETIFDQLAPEQQVIARDVFLRLIEPGDEGAQDSLRRVRPEELSQSPEREPAVRSVLTTLEAARLITAGEGTVEVAHEALIREWPALRRWLDESRADRRLHQRLAQAAHEWARLRREEGALYRGLPLATAAEWAAAHGPQLNALEREFIEASQALAERDAAEREAQRRRELEAAQKLAAAEQQRAAAESQRAEAEQKRAAAESLRAEGEKHRAAQEAQANTRLAGRNRVITIIGVVASVAATLACVSALIAGFLGVQSGQNAGRAQMASTQAVANAATAQAASTTAVTERLSAEQQARLALGREVAARAVSLLSRDPDLGLLLAVQSVQLTLKIDQTISSEAIESLGVALHGTHYIRSLAGHTGAVLTAGFSPDGRLILTTSEDGTARLWGADGTPVAALKGHSSTVVSASFRPDGKRVVTASYDKTARLWDANGSLLKVLDGHTDWVTLATFSPDGSQILTASVDGTARLWDADGNLLKVLGGGKTALCSASFSSDGSRIMTASTDGVLRLWDAQGNLLKVITTTASSVMSASVSPNGEQIAIGTFYGIVQLWGTQGNLLQTINGLPTVNSIVFSPDGKRFLAAGSDSNARLWDLQGNPIKILQGHTGEVNRATFSADGSRIVTASSDNTARVWDADGNLLTVLDGHAAGVRSAGFSPDGSRIVTASRDGTAKLWSTNGSGPLVLKGDWASFSPGGGRIVTRNSQHIAQLWNLEGDLLAVLDGHSAAITAISFRPDGSRIATASLDGTARLWDGDGRPLKPLEENRGTVWSIEFRPDGAQIVTADDDGNLRLWDAEGAPLKTLPVPLEKPSVATYSGDGQRILALGLLETVWLWGADGTLLKTLAGKEYSIVSFSFSRDGSQFVTGSFDGTVRLWDRDGNQILALAGPAVIVQSVAISPDKTRIWATYRDGSIRIWDEQGAPIKKFSVQRPVAVGSASFGPDGSRVLTASGDGLAELWDTAGNLLSVFEANTGWINSATFSPDGKMILTAGKDGVTRVWDISDYLSIEAMLSAAQFRAGRTLTNDECQQYLHMQQCP